MLTKIYVKNKKYSKYYLYSDLAVSAISNLASHTLELAAAILVTDSAFFAPFFPFFLLKKYINHYCSLYNFQYRIKRIIVSVCEFACIFSSNS